MAYALADSQNIIKKGKDCAIATLMLPPFKTRTFQIDFFCELSDRLALQSTCYQFDFPYMGIGKTSEYASCLPEQEMEQIGDLVQQTSRNHDLIYLVGMCLGAGFAIEVAEKLSIDKIVGLSVVDFENFKDFLNKRASTTKIVAINPQSSGEEITITARRAQWYDGKKTQESIARIKTPSLFIGYDQDPYIYSTNRRAISEAINDNKNCIAHWLVGKEHTFGKDREIVFTKTMSFLFD